MKSLIYTAVFLLLAAAASAQNLSVFNLDASNFPTLKAKFYAFDAQGNQQSPSAPEITVMENGIMRNVTSINCPLEQEPKQLSSVLVMDVSGSMSSGSGSGANIDIAKAAATYWISNVPLGESECAITSFDDNNYFNQDYTTNRNKLAYAIAALHPQEGTNYDAALLLPMSGGLEVTKLGKHQRIIVFLSDGLPNFSPQTSAIIAEAQKQNCMIFSVTVGLPCPQCLKDISDQTGANWFENITTQAQIEEVYREILQQAQGGSPCEITWKSDVTCIAGATNVQVVWKAQTVQLSYTPPANSVAQLQIAPQSLYIRSKPVGIKFDTTVTITAANAAFSVTNITSTNPAYDINPKSFSLKSGESKTLTVSYTPADSSYTWTRFDIATDLCAQTYYASASYPGHKPNVPTLKLTQPNGGEFLIVGADTVITWKGIPLTDTVKLEYSTDAGNSWNFITDKATGGKYSWHIPKTVSDKCLVRVSQFFIEKHNGWAKKFNGGNSSGLGTDKTGNCYIAGYFDFIDFGGDTLVGSSPSPIFLAKYQPNGQLEWAKQIYGGGNLYNIRTSINGMAIDDNQNIILTGYFSDTVAFGNILLKGIGENTGIYIAKYDPDGKVIWAKKAVGSGQGLSFAVATDLLGNSYITGVIYGSVDFGGIKLSGAKTNTFFIAKYNSDGGIEWAKSINTVVSFYNSIATDDFGNVFVGGTFYDNMNFGNGIILRPNVTNSSNFQSLDNDNIFLAKYHSDGTFEWAKHPGGISGRDYEYNISTDHIGNCYLTGSFQDSIDIGGVQLTSNKHGEGGISAGGDLFISKYRPDGNVEWAQNTTSDSSKSGYSSGLATTSDGDVFITGDFSDTLDFSGHKLVSAKGEQGYLAKYSSQGNVTLLKRTAGNGFGPILSVSPLDEIFLTGTMDSGKSAFDQDTLYDSGYNSFHDLSSPSFVWKIGNNLLQSDTSDALFSIVMPQALSEDVDMGKVLVSSAKDSVIKNFIRNGGSYPFRVDSITISGSDASQFALVSGIPPFDILSGGAHQVEFDFHPTSAGIKNAKINIYTQADTLIQNITGTGIAIDLFTSGSYIDFGKIEIGNYKDTTITAAITNSGNTTITFSASSQLGPDMKQFSVRSADVPFTLGPGASQSVTLRFNPKFIGRTSGRIAFAHNGANSPAILNVFGQALGGLIMIPNDSGYGGDHKDMPLILENESLASVQSAATNFRARIAYDHSVLTATGANIQTGNKFDTLTLTSPLGTSDTLAFIPFTALSSGSKTVSPMRIVDFTWLNGAGQPAEHDAETMSGIFHLLSLTKYPEPKWEASIVEIYPNPAKESFHFQITTSEPGRTQIELINILGQKAATIFDGEYKRGAHDLDFNTQGLPTGSYYLVLTTPSLRKMKKVDVIR